MLSRGDPGRLCGKPNCYFATGEDRHETTVLSYSPSGRTRTLMPAATDVAAVVRAAANTNITDTVLDTLAYAA